jgi:hypothetical protein
MTMKIALAFALAAAVAGGLAGAVVGLALAGDSSSRTPAAATNVRTTVKSVGVPHRTVTVTRGNVHPRSR